MFIILVENNIYFALYKANQMNSNLLLTVTMTVVAITATTVVTVVPTAVENINIITMMPTAFAQNVTGGSDVLIEEEEVVTEGNVTGGNMTTTAGGGGAQETANRQLDQAIKALESGDNAAAEGYMKEADKTLSEGEAKMHLGEAMKALQAGDIEGAMMHTQAAQGSLPVNIS
jgi:cellobiose-specific phosphotransferase system component IIA